MTLENTNMNIPETAVTPLVEQLAALYTNAVRRRVPFRALPTPFLWGPAGVGKSDGVRQMAQMLEKNTGKRVTVTDVRLLLYSPVDLRGVPVADAQRQFTNWLKPRIFAMDEREDLINILFLDELSAAPQSVQAAAYQITLDRRIGEHTLPENCIVIAAGNRTTDQSVSYKMPKALCNRLMHYSVQSDFRSWKAWAIRSGIDPRVVGYLSFDQSKLCVEPESSDLAYPTPRSWSFVSSILQTLTDDTQTVDSIHPMLAACVGTDTALAFETWYGVFQTLPKTQEILLGTCRIYPKRPDALYALISGLTSAVYDLRDTITPTELDHVCAYASQFPEDYAMAFFKDLNAIVSLKLMRCPSLQSWLSRHKKHL